MTDRRADNRRAYKALWQHVVAVHNIIRILLGLGFAVGLPSVRSDLGLYLSGLRILNESYAGNRVFTVWFDLASILDFLYHRVFTGKLQNFKCILLRRLINLLSKSCTWLHPNIPTREASHGWMNYYWWWKPFFQLPAALDKSVIFGLVNKPWFPLKTFENIFFLILFYSNNIIDSIKQYALCKRNPEPLSFRDHDFVSTVFLKKKVLLL